jgi:Ca2+-transporting ATPase
LVTDGLPGLALASESEELNIMKRPPKDPKQNIFTKRMAFHVLWVGFLMGKVTLGTQTWAIKHSIPHWQTIVFTTLCFSQIGACNGNSFPTEFRFSKWFVIKQTSFTNNTYY